MKRVIVRYTVKPDRADENQRYIEAVFKELQSTRPEGLRYASFRLADNVSFVHIAEIDRADGVNPLSDIAAFREFTSAIKERCDVPPVASDATLVGTYRSPNL